MVRTAVHKRSVKLWPKYAGKCAEILFEQADAPTATIEKLATCSSKTIDKTRHSNSWTKLLHNWRKVAMQKARTALSLELSHCSWADGFATPDIARVDVRTFGFPADHVQQRKTLRSRNIAARRGVKTLEGESFQRCLHRLSKFA